MIRILFACFIILMPLVPLAGEHQTDQGNPLDLRRTTLIVRDIERSLAFYRDALGMTVEYDQELSSPRLQRAGSDGVNRSRLVLLKANNDYIGMLGLWQFLDQTEHDRAAPAPADFTPGDIVLLFNARNLEEIFPKAAAVEGVKVVSTPTLRRYPSAAGDIEVMVSMLIDPDGHTVELNKLIRDPRREADPD
ncbi:MAG: VOC family protein [Alphaproteobacteria bacterium]|nr:MAG: VOC family protein [Alphaproteobacteria bacterium]